MYKTLEEQKQAITDILLSSDTNDVKATNLKNALVPMHTSLIYYTFDRLPESTNDEFEDIRTMLRAVCLNHIALLTKDQILVNAMPKAAYVVVRYAYLYLDELSKATYQNMLNSITDASYNEFKDYFFERVSPIPTNLLNIVDTRHSYPTFSEGEE
jgi:hypothetical protein